MAKKETTLIEFSFWDLWGDVVVDVASRAAKTFIQTASAAGLLGYAVSGDLPGLKVALLAGLSSAISCVWNAGLAWANR